MDAIEELLRDQARVSAGLRWRRDEHGEFQVHLDDHPPVCLRLDHSATQVCLHAQAGYLGRPGWLAARARPWSTVSDLPDGSRRWLVVGHDSGWVHVIQSWPRHRLDSVRFREVLYDFVGRVGRWRDWFPPEPFEDGVAA